MLGAGEYSFVRIDCLDWDNAKEQFMPMSALGMSRDESFKKVCWGTYERR